jgi:hypothetical protein
MSGQLPAKTVGGRPQLTTRDVRRERKNAHERAKRAAKSTKPKRGRPVTVPGGKSARLTLRVPNALRARVEAHATDRGMTVGAAVCALLDAALRLNPSK